MVRLRSNNLLWALKPVIPSKNSPPMSGATAQRVHSERYTQPDVSVGPSTVFEIFQWRQVGENKDIDNDIEIAGSNVYPSVWQAPETRTRQEEGAVRLVGAAARSSKHRAWRRIVAFCVASGSRHPRPPSGPARDKGLVDLPGNNDRQNCHAKYGYVGGEARWKASNGTRKRSSLNGAVVSAAEVREVRSDEISTVLGTTLIARYSARSRKLALGTQNQGSPHVPLTARTGNLYKVYLCIIHAKATRRKNSKYEDA
ncbi:hypothetical protein CYLTODRAFT_445658 [Cylindrobasidium torrendii FP15055 ss-10]|uniref:Uncharacterized protein n=1 Tax=Cylindrobasidium torrendii FP15055 ss-10 TaxID=1314674 RepID=A0A0D7B3Z9_9AGAR|nr:hypothetical protein CYLTODRAFT_445658 [Cylindrobasidium torrendii FP15055 ss-10]